MKKLYPLLFFLQIIASLEAQVIYHHPDNVTTYDFLQELAAAQLIDYNAVVQPISRQTIANYLKDTFPTLNNRQAETQKFLLRDFNKEIIGDKGSFYKRKDAFYYTNEKSKISINPILGGSYRTTLNGLNRYFGVQVEMYLGKNWGVYASFREYYEQKQVTSPNFLNQNRGGEIRYSPFQAGKLGAIDYTEMRGGITYDWKWGHIGLVQDHFVWGSNYNGATIFSGRIPAMPQLKIQVKPFDWLEFNSTHVWLQSNLLDSSRTYKTGFNTNRVVMREKYLTANFISIRPFKNLWFSAGNSTIYSDIGIHPSYLLPFFFWRPIDHLLSGNGGNNSGQNGQLYLDISSRNIKHLHLYSTLFIDETSLSSAFKTNAAERRNQISTKIGARYYNLFNQNASLIFEYTRSNPFAYRHYIPATDFTSSGFNFGHYLGDNSQEIYTAFTYKPMRGLFTKFYYLSASKGIIPNFQAGQAGSTGVPFQEKIAYTQKEIGLEAKYEVINDVFIFANFIQSDINDTTKKYITSALNGKNFYVHGGFSIGF